MGIAVTLKTPKHASRAVRPATSAVIVLKAKTVVGGDAAVLRARREVVAAKARRAIIVGRLAMLRASVERARVEGEGEDMLVRLEAMVVHRMGMSASTLVISVAKLGMFRGSVDRVVVEMKEIVAVEAEAEAEVEEEVEEEDQGEGGKSFLHAGTRL
jgi:hypothetical protein